MTQDTQAIQTLKSIFGYDSFRPGQEELVRAILNGRDALGIMPTGAGKSICYQVPALMLPGITLVISPLISLMKDQVQALNQAGVHAAYINSSLSEGQIAKALQFAARGQYKMIYVAPERLETQNFREFVRQVEISMVTVDEAHCISQWGQDFRPSYLKIVQFIRTLEKRPIVSAFTATATERVKEDILCVLGLESPEVLVTGFDRSNLYFGVETPPKKDDFVLDYIRAHEADSGIIYCATRKNVDKVYENLQRQHVPVVRYHAGLSPEERQANQEDFIYDRSPVMVATNAFGMGIDKSNVRYVLHYNMPQSMENYYQEAGRAGRDGEPSECILLFSPQDMMINRYLLDSKVPNPELDEEENQSIRAQDERRLSAMAGYCRTTGCLRDYILRYFGEYGSGACGNCSTCSQEYEEVDITAEAKQIIACIREVRGRYGINVIAGILAGSDRAKLREYHAASYAAYGVLKEHSEADVKRIIEHLEAEGYLKVTMDKYALLRLTDQADAISQEGRCLTMKKPKEAPQSASSRAFRKSDILNARGLDLFEELRTLRTQLARQEGIPPYMIFSDKTLVDMCVKAPLTEEAMFTVNGVGQNKFDRYGVRFMEAVRAFTGGEPEKLYFGGQEEAVQAAAPKAKRTVKKESFYLTRQQAERFVYAERYLATELAERMSALREEETVKRLTGADIYRLMQAEEFVSERREDGVYKKLLSPEGEEAGLLIGMRTSKKGNEYEDVFYTEKAQRMIIEKYVRDERMEEE